MRTLSTTPAAAVIAGWALAAALLTCCNGGLPSSSLPPEVPPQAHAAPGTDAARPNAVQSRKSWLSADAKAAKALLYVASGSTVDVYAWPALDQVGSLTGFQSPGGMCVDKRGDVYVTDITTLTISEYPHDGLTPIARLTDAYGSPEGCSVDPKTGNLAVSTAVTSSGLGNVLVFTHARGMPKAYSTADVGLDVVPAYDPNGNLFVDGYDASIAGLAELPSGGGTFESITLDQTIDDPTGLDWDGKYLAIADASTGTIYQLSVSGTTATVAGSTSLTDGRYLDQFWVTGISKNIQGDEVVGASYGYDSVDVWSYPSGGQPSASISGLSEPAGVVISAK